MRQIGAVHYEEAQGGSHYFSPTKTWKIAAFKGSGMRSGRSDAKADDLDGKFQDIKYARQQVLETRYRVRFQTFPPCPALPWEDPDKHQLPRRREHREPRPLHRQAIMTTEAHARPPGSHLVTVPQIPVETRPDTRPFDDPLLWLTDGPQPFGGLAQLVTESTATTPLGGRETFCRRLLVKKTVRKIPSADRRGRRSPKSTHARRMLLWRRLPRGEGVPHMCGKRAHSSEVPR